MKARTNFTKRFAPAQARLRDVRKLMAGTGKGLLAGATGATLYLANMGKTVRNTAVDLKDRAFNKQKSGEVFEVKRSTVIALLVALAAVAGVLGALYFYVLRREKELDEYEQLLFSEDFNDDVLDPVDEPEPDDDKV